MDRDELVPYTGREQASVKHFLLESYLARLIMITGQKRFEHIAYVDAFAGPWQAAQSDFSDTSFARAVDVMESCRAQLATEFRRSVSFRALFVERELDRFIQLKSFAEARSTNSIQITAINDDFAESAESVARWIRNDEIAFVLIDPTGWKNVISPKTLAPLLCKSNVEILINVMWNFINLASGHSSQARNLRDIFGKRSEALTTSGAGGDEWVLEYLDHLKVAAKALNPASRLRTAWFPVEFPAKDRVFYYLAYVTHHLKGIIVFLEESEKTLHYQRQVKFVVEQKRRELATGMSDIFGDSLNPTGPSNLPTIPRARLLWLERLPNIGSDLYVDESQIAEMTEACGCLISRLQTELKRLIDEGILTNSGARRSRTKNFVNYRKGEMIRRIK